MLNFYFLPFCNWFSQQGDLIFFCRYMMIHVCMAITVIGLCPELLPHTCFNLEAKAHGRLSDNSLHGSFGVCSVRRNLLQPKAHESSASLHDQWRHHSFLHAPSPPKNLSFGSCYSDQSKLMIFPWPAWTSFRTLQKLMKLFHLNFSQNCQIWLL